MRLIESHAHIYLDDFKEDREAMIMRAQEVGVEHIVMPNIDKESIDHMLELSTDYPLCHATMGLHPCSVGKDFEKQLYLIEDWLSKEKFCAVGEIGTDLYWDKTFFEQQKEAFNVQCELAIKHDIPVIIHCRESIDETIELVSEFQGRGLKGVFHCFTGSVQQLKKIVSLGFHIGIGGVATFKNGGIQPAIKEMPMESLLLETDSPYLAPTPLRGKRNEPSYLRLIGERVADLKDTNLEEIGEVSSKNAEKLFGL